MSGTASTPPPAQETVQDRIRMLIFGLVGPELSMADANRAVECAQKIVQVVEPYDHLGLLAIGMVSVAVQEAIAIVDVEEP